MSRLHANASQALATPARPRPLRAIRADAEARVALGDLPGAADRLRAGQRRARSGGTVDFIEVSVIDARLRDIEVQRKKNEADERVFK